MAAEPIDLADLPPLPLSFVFEHSPCGNARGQAPEAPTPPPFRLGRIEEGAGSPVGSPPQSPSVSSPIAKPTPNPDAFGENKMSDPRKKTPSPVCPPTPLRTPTWAHDGPLSLSRKNSLCQDKVLLTMPTYQVGECQEGRRRHGVHAHRMQGFQIRTLTAHDVIVLSTLPHLVLLKCLPLCIPAFSMRPWA